MKNLKQSYIRLFLLLLLLLTAIVGFGNPSYQFLHYNINNGLSQNTVLSIFQDKEGFMWFGTKDGLNRFDGESFNIFRFPTNKELRDNVFRCILQDRDEKIWVGTDDGIYIYDPFYETFEFFNLKTRDNNSIRGLVSHMIVDNDGDIWISVEEGGVFMYNYIAKELDYYDIKTTLGGLKGITLCEDKGKGVWVFPHSRPIIRIDKKNKKMNEFTLNSEKSLVYNTGAIGAVIADGDNLLVGTTMQGLISINVSNRTSNKILASDQKGSPIFIRDILKHDDNLWIASESGIYIYNLYTGEVENLNYSPSKAYSLSDNAIYSLYKDSEDGIWIGSFFGGVDYFPNRGTNFQPYYPIIGENSINGYRVREFHQSSDGNIWIGTEDNGLNLFNPKKSIFLDVNNSLKSLYTNIHALCNDDTFLWIGVFSKGLYKYNLKDKTLKRYKDTNQKNSLYGNFVFSILKDSQKTLWIGTLSGLNKYNYDSDDFERVTHLEGAFIRDIKEDSEGDIWFATVNKGLYRFNPSTKAWRNYLHNPSDSTSLPYNKTTSVFEDSEKNLWITTEGGGFGLFNKKNDSFSTIDNSKGLPNNVVYEMLEDDEGYLWLSTNSGLIRYSHEKEQLINYTTNDGLKTNQFNYKSSFKTNDGTLYFGSIDGFVRFNPTSFKVSSFIPPIIFTQLLINNYPQEILDDVSPLKKSLQYTNELKLNHNQNSFSLKYAVLSFSENMNQEVQYKLEGFNKDWILVDESRTISYSNIPSGKYTLLVTVSNSDNIKKLIIFVKPPFWFTWWAYLVYVFLLIGSIYMIIKYLNKRSERKQLQQMHIFEQENERKLYRSKIEFFTNVAHEIRTPLSLIKAPLDVVLKNPKVSIDIKDNLSIMSKNTDRLLRLTNQLLDFQKTESELYTLDLETHDISQLVKETFLLFTPLSKIKDITFNLKLSENDIITQIDKEAFTKIITNLINNAIKYCEKFVEISLSLTEINNEPRVEFVTRNDGMLIHENYRDEIYKPFIHIDRDKDKMITGTGIGLALSKSLIELMRGKITYEVADGLNVFSISFPANSVDQTEMKKNGRIKNEKISDLKIKNNHEKVDKLPVVLIVEDDNDMNEFLKKCLNSKYQVLQAFNGEEALKIIENENVNIIVSDVMMPRMDGYKFTEKIKTSLETSHIPVILLTAKTNNQSKIQGYEIGADMYIEKPFSVDILQAQIANLLQNRETLRDTFMKNPFIGAVTIALTKSDEKFINKLNDVVQRNLSDSDFNVEDMAEQFNMSRASFYRKIKGVLDLTPNEYIRVERLKKSAQLLKQKDYKVNEICYMVGFNSPSYFAKCFQQQFGILPKDFQ